MKEKELEELCDLIDMPKRELRLLVGSDNGIQDRLNETKGWTRGDLISEAVSRGLTTITLYSDDGSLLPEY